jgi:hypothetical protein
VVVLRDVDAGDVADFDVGVHKKLKVKSER